MNIFYLDHNVKSCAEQHVDKHVVKMIVEYAQLLSTAHRVIDGEEYEDRSKNNRKIKRSLGSRSSTRDRDRTIARTIDRSTSLG